MLTGPFIIYNYILTSINKESHKRKAWDQSVARKKLNLKMFFVCFKSQKNLRLGKCLFKLFILKF